MKSIKQIFRLLYINWVLARNGLDQLIVSIHLFAPFRFIVYLNPWTWWRRQPLTRGEALRKTLEELGPIFIKFGQALSTRPDILPPDIALELCKLQDKVPPFPSEQALAIIAAAYGRSAFDVFAEFDTQVLASASMAQVHAARLISGEEVVVKILRPNMRKVIEKDLSIMHTIANFADRYWPESKRLKPKEIVAEFEHSLLNELDLQREAANAGQLRRNFFNSPLLYIPEVFWDYTRENILVMERIYGIPVADVATLRDYSIDIKKLAERGVEIFFTQVFRDCFFHADMHPGNIFVSTQHPNNPQYICIDFGIIGTLNENDKRYLAENLYAFFNRDYRRVAQLHVESGWVARNTRIEEFESAIRTVCEPIFEKPLKDISFAQVVLRLFQVARRFQMEVQPQLVLLQKTLLAIEGLGRQLYPELDLWATAKPFLEKWLKEQIGPKAFFERLKENLPFFAEQLPHMPRLLNDLLVLSKEEKIRSLMLSADNPVQNRQHAWNKGLGAGIFSAMLTLSALSFLDLIAPEKIAPVTLIAALVGGMIMLINRTNRSE
ncbi:ubiquinone biosynthesis regulatory protein kinase UbiB [Legionella taurinensis]|uniref:Probable protein kinase UbiB n=1 Tax=Legionella taurinensis TaxID=70611 RepID=A0A3A5L4G3_9GAMM|nr:ubiquinone biosynthesis regulatory protein kinase UbiB [Legionella taurinensis]MDX1836145.1 ubiquinone biosynthesis regulatory protein kinase UbiB [Legionella taurinensis]PUT42083.1 ubiquinone biosynthesis regulatory protein kinase UbiB [Legionella taurinensis]PUT44870.1 ubiquinone biosynthesis regulatory protein kinase UbiB [Legionella taurinensis]PUT48191.1 ubiquinone biosynthesis regulatory protein kinase UbiB [Legionella taurinensis]PUT49005.1 ubiquinone biosynthesis regulatory protein 